jgi:cytochrome c peroxidase
MNTRSARLSAITIVIAALFTAICFKGGHGAQAQASDPRPYLVPVPLGLIEPDIPSDNPLTVGKIELGKKLFFDKRLSLKESMSCATCHSPTHGFAEARPVSVSANGDKQRRNAPTVLNAGYLPVLTWDGRFRLLEQQALEPFSPWGDMSIELGEVMERVAADPDYQRMFREVFGAPPSVDALGKSLAAYQRSLVSGGTRFDEYLYGEREDALTDLEKLGYELFVGRGSCINCHDIFHKAVNPLGGGIATFTDNRFHNLGVGYSKGVMKDTGRFETTRDPDDWGAFKTPTLRNVALTPPYMHDGSLATLEDVIDFYNKGGVPNPNIAPGLHVLHLTDMQKQALVAFLQALTDPELERQMKGGSNAQANPSK